MQKTDSIQEKIANSNQTATIYKMIKSRIKLNLFRSKKNPKLCCNQNKYQVGNNPKFKKFFHSLLEFMSTFVIFNFQN